MRTAAIIGLVLFSVAAPPPDRPHDLATQAAKQIPATCHNITNEGDCHKLPAGCEGKPNPGYDADLAFLKNQLILPAAADPLIKRTFTNLAQFQALDAKTRALGQGKQQAVAQELAGYGVGEIDVVIGYLYYDLQTGAEACNCRLTDPADTDIHIGIGFDPTIAATIAAGHYPFSTDKNKPDGAHQTSIVVEMTPHDRAQYHKHWNTTLADSLMGQRVKVVGQLLVDTDHNEPAQNCALATAKKDKTTCWRGSVWELHPITRLFVCKTGKTCANAASPDWQEQP